MPFNEGQLKAIQQRDASILVSAPAGSGKTKILVSRIVELLKEGYEIFDFLVLTFTQAAGNEMKQRLSEELHQLVSTDIDLTLKEHLEKQILNLPHAYMTNFHGFCNLLLMKYGYLVNVMPGFEINSDPSMIKKAVLQECLEKWILDEHIKEFLSLYFPGYSLDAFSSLLLSIDELSHSIDDFYGFVDHMKKQNYDTLSSALEEWPLFPYLKQIFYNESVLALNKLIELKYYAENHNLTDFYERPDEQTEKNQELPIPFEAYYDYLDERIKVFSQPITYDTLVSMASSSVPKAYNMNWKEIDSDTKKTFTKMKTDILLSYNKSVKTYLEEDPDDFVRKLQISYQAIDILISEGHLLNQFQNAYQERKKQLNQLDFSDLERYAHQLLEPQYGIVDVLYHRLKEIMVDEYQDTNQIQESLLLKISEYQQPAIPLFMVGDMKQSIYRFRQADPQIFSNKYDTFSLSDEDCQKTHTRRIDLVFNYRSSKIVLDSINYIFNQIMDKDIGGLEYYLDDSARLNYDYVGKENNQKESARTRFFSEKHLATEVLIDIYNPSSSLDKEQYEAHMVAQKILKLKQEMKIKNKPVDFKDMVVLMRSTVSFLTFKKVFDLYQIPNHIVLSQGLMNSNEIENMMTFLQGLAHPYDDVALLSILRQPYTMSNIDMETIAKLRTDHKEIPLYECLSLSSDKRVINFLNIFNELRLYSYTHSPYDVLKEIYRLTDYPLFVSKLINGSQRKSNLDLFLEIVLQTQEQNPYLAELIETLKNSSDFAPAQSSSESDNVVEFMTIHKSKGLEFPIVFVCNMHKQFNTQDSKERMMIDKRLGIALKPRMRKNTENLNNLIIEYENCYRNMIARRQLDESINEEMRIFYVALTRASHKLILTGVLKSIDEIAALQEKLLVNESPDIYHRENAGTILLYDRLRKTNNYLSWTLSSILRHPQIIEQCLQIEQLKQRAQLLKKYHFEKQMTLDSTEHAMFCLFLTNDQTIEQSIPKRQKESLTMNGTIQEHYRSFKYPFDLEKPKTMSVTQLQAIADDHYLSLAKDEETALMTATDKGTLVHLLLSHLSFQEDHIEQLINQLYENHLCNEDGRQVLLAYQDQIYGFIHSDYYQMIKEASYIYKEKPFSYYDKNLDQVIHGIFDLVFVYKDQLYVLDYKTDRISKNNSEDALIEKHKVQLNYYQRVLKDMYKQDIKAIVYYLHISKGVEF
ncbi:UvrD-helicase domain-containing protein [Coprobacillus cateniformis]|jgi:ATP-dependent helicase/nuclease subunit A|uniref:UvrD-helicase domain-containing protein n=1 Tax=Coprobacillus cateniformis TaxID=100884 RepID=UPI0024A8303C|nr:UvrD-helicase domain-containing protein [Coprobacillus cateniformis]